MKACPVCATAFDPLQGKYAPDGSVVCGPCGDRLKSAAGAQEKKNLGSVFVGALGAVFIALFSFAFRLRVAAFALPLIAAACGGLTGHTALRHPDAAAVLGWKRWPTAVLGGLAILLALVSLIVSGP